MSLWSWMLRDVTEGSRQLYMLILQIRYHKIKVIFYNFHVLNNTSIFCLLFRMYTRFSHESSSAGFF